MATTRILPNLERVDCGARGRDIDRQEGLGSGTAIRRQAPARCVAIRRIRSDINDDGRTLPHETTARVLGRRNQRYGMTTPRGTRGTRHGSRRSVLIIHSHRECRFTGSKMPFTHLAIAWRTRGIVIHQQVITATGTHHFRPAQTHPAQQRQHRDHAECSRSMRKCESHGVEVERPGAAGMTAGVT